MVLVMLQLIERPKGVERGVRVSRRGRMSLASGGLSWLMLAHFSHFFRVWGAFCAFSARLGRFLAFSNDFFQFLVDFSSILSRFGKDF